MTKAILRKGVNGLVAETPGAVEFLMGLSFGTDYNVNVVESRNASFHRKFFALISATYDMQEFFDSKEAYRRWLTMKCGYFSSIVCPSGSTVFVADSISFAKMSQEDFEELYSTAIDVFIRELGEKLTRDDIDKVLTYA